MSITNSTPTVNGSTNRNGKAYLFGNPNTLMLIHNFNGFGSVAEAASQRIFDITGADITKGGEVHLSRADNDVYPRNGGFANASFGLKITTKNMTALNTFSKGDELTNISVLYEGRAEARAQVLMLALSGGIVYDDVAISAQHGAEPGTGTLGIEATIPVGSDGMGTLTHGPYHVPWSLNVLDADSPRDDTWTPKTVSVF